MDLVLFNLQRLICHENQPTNQKRLLVLSDSVEALWVCLAQSAELQNTPTASLQRGKTPPMSVLDMTLNNQMVRLE